jgi:septation ring formation regulator EzrA
MLNLNTRLDNLEVKMRQLLNLLDDISGENRQLAAENNNLKKELQEVKMKLLTDNSPMTQTVKVDEKELNRIKSELNNYIEEVDHCINLLES